MSLYKKNIFQCKYCPRSFSRRGAFRNHLQSHRDKMYLDENNLTREEENINTSGPRSAITRSTQRIALSPILINDTISPREEQTSDMNVHDFWEVKFIHFFNTSFILYMQLYKL